MSRAAHRAPHRAPRRLRRVLAWTAGTLAVLVLASVGAAVAYYRHLDGQITRVHGVIAGGDGPVRRSDGSTAPPPAPAANYLLVGSDSRAGANRRLPHAGGDSCRCADTIIVAHVPRGHDKAVLVSIPRDSWVTIPAHTDAAGRPVAARQAKVNAALALGGPGLLVRTVQALTGLRIDHYVQVDFTGFVDMVDAVHGVDVCLTAPARDRRTGIDLSAGVHHLDGVTALEYVRQRHGLTNGDLDRIRRQQAVIGQVADKVLSGGILLHPGRLTDFLDVVTKSVTVDDGLSLADMRGLATTFGRLDRDHVAFATAPVADIGGERDGQSVVLLDHRRLNALFDRVAAGRLPGGRATGGGRPASPAPSPDRSPASPAPAGVTCLA